MVTRRRLTRVRDLLAAATGGSVKRYPNGLTLVERTWFVPPWATAWTLGHTIFSRRVLSARLLRHELAHVVQFEEHGWRFPFLYLWESLRTLSYRRNKYEVEARAVEVISSERPD